ncbi:MAG: pyridoxamine 5'-phosphate oxidase family protein [Micrococcales bacterium]|nr:pyridoxamine 5'-phosphate oxidase family protein [Micrococcales bacterium]
MTGHRVEMTGHMAVGMPLTNPWLAGSSPDRELPRDQLEDRILNLLSSNNLAVIATVNRDGSPAATPVRYSSLGFEIFYTSWNASVKSRNLRRDPRVSTGIVAPLVGQASSGGAQLFGTARTLERGDPAADPYCGALAVRPCRARQVPGRTACRPADGHHAESDPVHRALASSQRLQSAPDLASAQLIGGPGDLTDRSRQRARR